MGGQRHWKDGRDVYDVIMGLLDYPETEAHPSFTLSLQTDFEDGGGGDTMFRFVGSEGAINVSFTSLSLSRVGIAHESADQVLKGYNSVRTFSKAQQEALAAKLKGEPSQPRTRTAKKEPERFVVPKGYDERFDHFVNFFKSMRDKTPVYEDATFGLRAAAPALLCNDSYRLGKLIGWDPVALRVVS
jgi:hypothetical protein